MAKKTDILIVGAGMAGLSLGALLGAKGMRVTIIDREDPAFMVPETFDSRTIALSAGTKKILEPLGLWTDLVTHGTAITQIDVQEGHDAFVLNFQSADVGNQPFGWILPNSAVRKALYESCLANKVTFVTGHTLEAIEDDANTVTAILSNDQRLSAPLLVGADGRNSRVRNVLGIDTVDLDYKHLAMVGLIEHEHPHHGLALERFYPSGPFAALPFTDAANGRARSAIVWSRHTRSTKQLPIKTTDLKAIARHITPMLDERYGAIEAVGIWANYPLALCHAKSFIGPRVALISDAAHGIHPIAGQGLNLGMRDIAYLADTLPSLKEAGEDWGSDTVLRAYQSARRVDVFAMIAATDLLTRLFGNGFPPLRAIRSLGLGIVEKIPPLKRFFMHQAMGG